jgi:fatty acid desaturase
MALSPALARRRQALGRGLPGPAHASSLQSQINRLRQPDNHTNLVFLVWEYLCIAAVIASTVYFAENCPRWGLPWTWNIPVFALAIILIGALQHRLAGLGHEASHYSLFRNKLANDLLGDLLCFFPILSSVHLYRLFHMAHHQYTNDPDHDPDLVNMGRSKKVDQFPMPRLRFVALYFFRWLCDPVSLVRFEFDYVYVNMFGKGGNVYMKRAPGGDAENPHLRPGTALGLLYLAAFALLTWWLTSRGRTTWLFPAAALAITAAALVTLTIPRPWIFVSPFRQPYGERAAAILRLSYYTLVLTILAAVRSATLGRSAVYPVLLWLVPLNTSFIFFLLLRDVYQHANAPIGRLTNSRVFFPDPFTRWAVFVYGQDIHLTHHLCPAVPHYRLLALHRLLQREDPEYAAQVVECHGTLQRRGPHPTILDTLAQPLEASSSA